MENRGKELKEGRRKTEKRKDKRKQRLGRQVE